MTRTVFEIKPCIFPELSMSRQKYVYTGMKHLRNLGVKFPCTLQAMQARGGVQGRLNLFHSSQKGRGNGGFFGGGGRKMSKGGNTVQRLSGKI